MPYADAGGLRMYYEVLGEGPALLFIPGLSTDLTRYQRITEILARRLQVTVLDNRGAGRTEMPDAPYTIEQMAGDTAALCDALGIHRTSVLGISMGGRIAFELALQRPDLVEKLILVSTGVRPPRGTFRYRLRYFVMTFPLLRRFGRPHPQPSFAFRRQRAASRSYNGSAKMGEIHVPTLILHGRKDALAPFAGAEALHAGIRGSALVELEGGHLTAFFHPERFAREIVDFVEGGRTVPAP